MARYSPAYSALARRMEEIDEIVSMARSIERMPVIPRNMTRVNALCRGGIVLLCSHLEGYIEDLGTLAIDRIGKRQVPKNALSEGFRYHLSRDLVTGIFGTDNPNDRASRVLAFLKRDQHIWDSSHTFSHPLPVNSIIGRFSTPNHARIGHFFNRFGYTQFRVDLERTLKSQFHPCRNMVDHIVDQRNKIAHGDYSTAGTPGELDEMCRLARLYCRTTDHIVGNWFKAVGCPIR